METVRSDSVVQRVVAWHNRHPLAERITPQQVHSIGVVELPFAVQDPQWADDAPAGPAPEPGDPSHGSAAGITGAAPAQPAAPVSRPETLGRAEVVIEDVDAADEPPEARAGVDGEPAVPADGEGAGDEPPREALAADPSPEGTSPTVRRTASAAASADAGASGSTAGDADAPRVPDSSGAAPAAGAAAAAPSPLSDNPPAATRRLSSRPSLPPGWHPRSWTTRLRRAWPLWPAFGEDFIAPLSPRRVGRWAARHGAAHWPLEPEAPLRVIATDADRAGTLPEGAAIAPLYVLTAAIDGGSRRQRLLLSPDPRGPVIGPRQWSQRRAGVAVAGALAAIGVAAIFGLQRPDDPAALQASVQQAAAAASSASAAGSAPSAVASLASVPSAPSAVPAASAATSIATASAASAATDTGGTRAAADAASAAAPVARLQAEAAGPPASASASLSESGTETGKESHAAPARVARPSAVPGVTEARRGRIALQPIVPALDDAARAAARQQATALRRGERPGAGSVPGADDKAFALVTAPMRSRAQSERAAAQLQALAQLLPGGLRAELMPAGKAWRAVCWPFASPEAAEKVRLALADKGLKTDVLEF